MGLSSTFAQAEGATSRSQGSDEDRANACWSAEALAGKPNDKVIVKDTRKAIVAPPEDVLAPYLPKKRGAIRRVELPPGVKKVALTFDLCEQPYEVAGYDAGIVNVLRRWKVRTTFFGGGKWMMTHPEQAQQIIADPLFEMGNHAWEHRNLRLLEGQRQVDEIRWAQAAYERQVKKLASRQCLARDGKPFKLTDGNVRMSLFRFPFGACNPAALDAVASLGLLPIQWDVSSGDPTKGLSAEAMASAVARQVRPGSIVLFHANGRGWSTAAALELLIPKLMAMGYEFATVSDLFQTKGATWKTEPICYDSRPGDVDRHDGLARRLDEAYQRFYARFGTPDPARAANAPERGVEASPLADDREPPARPAVPMPPAPRPEVRPPEPSEGIPSPF